MIQLVVVFSPRRQSLQPASRSQSPQSVQSVPPKKPPPDPCDSSHTAYSGRTVGPLPDFFFWRGAILQCIHCIVLPATRAGSARIPRIRCRPLHTLHRLARRRLLRAASRLQKTNLAVDPLLGGGDRRSRAGGSAATRRRRNEQSEIAGLRQQLASLAKAVEALGAHRPRRLPSQQRRATPASNAGSLWSQVGDHFQQATQAGHDPSDDQVRALLQKLLRNNAPSGPASAPHSPGDDTPENNDSTQPGSWAAVVAKNKPKCQLWAADWPADVKILSLAAFKNLSECKASVVHCGSVREVSEATAWCKARAFTGITVVCTDSSAEHDSKVLVKTGSGSKLQDATLTFVGDGAPKRRALPTGFKDDTAEPNAPEVPTTLCRLTLAREFALPALYARVAAKPQCLPSALLGADAPKVLQTRGAATYESEVTCLIKVKEDWVPKLLALSLEVGAFVFRHRDASAAPPQWLTRPKEASPSDYWKQAKTEMDSTGGRLAYRPSKSSCLGIAGANSAAPGAQIPSWLADGCPRDWLSTDLGQWAETRGFTECGEYQRRGARRWAFRARPPTTVSELTQTFNFSSGISMSRATRRPNSAHPRAPAANTWGASPLPNPAPAQPPVVNPSPDAAVSSSPDADMGKEGETQNKRSPDAAVSSSPDADMGKEGDPSPPAKKHKPAPECFQSAPFADHFGVIECGGDGDCAYCTIAQGFYDVANKKSKNYVPADFRPKGRLQAQMRTLASKELVTHGPKYALPDGGGELAGQVSEAGHYANSQSLHALATATHAEFRIFAFDSKLSRWNFYVVASNSPKPKPRVVWMRLQAKHYQLLRPKGLGPPADLVKQWTTHAVYKPEHLEGEGHELDPDALSFLGLHSAAASARRGLASAPSRVSASASAQRVPGQCVDAEYAVGGHLKCPCGWPPSTKDVTFKQAKTHWRHCRGILPPKAAAADLAEFRSGLNAREAQLKTNRAKAKYCKWHAKLPAKARNAAHSLDLTKGSLEQRGWTYQCTGCRNYRTINHSMTIPCPSRPDRSVSALDFVAMVQPDRHKKFKTLQAQRQKRVRLRLKATYAADPNHWKKRYANLKANRPEAYARKRLLEDAASKAKRKRPKDAKRAAMRRAAASS